jgi:hypothetical protein
MFLEGRYEFLAGLETLRKRLCQYGPNADRCDCKYGASGQGEESGCPELREAIAILEKVGKREFVRLARLAGDYTPDFERGLARGFTKVK